MKKSSLWGVEGLLIVLPFLSWAIIEIWNWSTDDKFTIPSTVLGAGLCCIALALIGLHRQFRYRRRLSAGKMMKVFDQQLADVRVRFMIRICNAEVEKLSKAIFNRVAETEFWDWTFVTTHPDLRGFDPSLFRTLQEEYWNRVDEVHTSSLSLIPEEPFGRKNIVLFGEISLDREEFGQTTFPSQIWGRKFEIHFDSLIEYKVDIDADGNHVRSRAEIDDSAKIEAIWDELRAVLYPKIDQTLVWTEKSPPEAKDLADFMGRLKKLAAPAVSTVRVLNDDLGFVRKWKALRGSLPWYHFPTFFLGYLLSPLSFYNDAVVNLPIALACARLIQPASSTMSGVWTAVFYVITNLVGVAMMWWPWRGVANGVRLDFLEKFGRLQTVGLITALTVGAGVAGFGLDYVLGWWLGTVER